MLIIRDTSSGLQKAAGLKAKCGTWPRFEATAKVMNAKLYLKQFWKLKEKRNKFDTKHIHPICSLNGNIFILSCFLSLYRHHMCTFPRRCCPKDYMATVSRCETTFEFSLRPKSNCGLYLWQATVGIVIVLLVVALLFCCCCCCCYSLCRTIKPFAVYNHGKPLNRIKSVQLPCGHAHAQLTISRPQSSISRPSSQSSETPNWSTDSRELRHKSLITRH